MSRLTTGRSKALKMMVVIAVLAMVTAACGAEDSGGEVTTTAASGDGGSETTTTTETPTTGDTTGDVDVRNEIVVAQTSDVLTLDPSTDTSPISLNVFKHIFDQLTDIKADGSVGPLLASGWTSEDAQTWEFTLQENAVFHNGDPVTVEDVIFTYEKINADEESPVRTYLRTMESIEKVDDRTVRFVLTSPFAAWPRQTSLISIMPQSAYESMGPDAFATEPIGSGAFRLVEWVKDDHLTIEAFDDYWAGPPPVERVIWRPVPSEASRVAGLESGELDVVALLPPPEVPRLEAEEGINVVKVASNRVLYLGINPNSAPLDDLNLRKAINAAIDREAITEQLLGGLGVPIGQVVAPVTFGYDPSIGPATYDPALAADFLAQSNYGGEPIVLQYPNNRYAFGVEVVEAVAGFLSAVGINVQLEGMEYSAFFPLWRDNQLNTMHLFGYGPSIMDAQLPLGSLFASGSRGYWTDPRVDELIAAQRAEVDDALRAEQIAEIWQISNEALPYIYLYNEVQAYGISDRVEWTPRADERLFFHEAVVKG